MAYGNTGMGFIVVLVIMLWSGGAKAQSDCTSVLISMSPCVNYITGNSSTPSSQCCTQLASVVRSSPQCLCQVLNGGGSSLGINVNQTQAKSLPGACRVQTPPISSCDGKNVICHCISAAPAAIPSSILVLRILMVPKSPSVEIMVSAAKSTPWVAIDISNIHDKAPLLAFHNDQTPIAWVITVMA